MSKKPEIDDVLYFFVKIQNVSQNWPEAGLRRRVFLTLNEVQYRTTSQSTQKIISLLMNDQKPKGQPKQGDTFNVPLLGNARWLNKVSSA